MWYMGFERQVHYIFSTILASILAIRILMTGKRFYRPSRNLLTTLLVCTFKAFAAIFVRLRSLGASLLYNDKYLRAMATMQQSVKLHELHWSGRNGPPPLLRNLPTSATSPWL